MTGQFIDFINRYESRVAPLSRELSLTYFNATVSGKKEDYDKAAALQLELNKIYSDKNDFKLLSEFKLSGKITNPLLKRELELIYNAYASNQFDEVLMEKIITLSTKVEEKFATFRVSVKGEEITDNKVDDILNESVDSKELEEVWRASKKIGNAVVDEVKLLAEMRNESAKIMGYKNYYDMSLTLSEQNPDDIEKLFDELDDLTRPAFISLKNEIDTFLSKRISIPKEKLMPWHYQDKYFQHGPHIYSVDLDAYYRDKDIVKLTRDFFEGIGLNADDLIEKSDLFEKPGKYQHAYCTDIDRDGDIRVVCNVKPNYKWMGTMLHEYGHAVYDKFIDRSLPWELRTHAHIFATEAIAMFFGRMAADPEWIQIMTGISDEEKNKIAADCFNSFRLEQLVFSRWVQVMFRFEKSMYENPLQDLNALWWSLVEKYQMIKKPEGRDEPDWASKIHVALYPAYYHNYMLGELLASQFHYFLLNKNGGNYSGRLSNASLGKYFIEEFFSHGAKYKWDSLIKQATGENLSPKFYAMQILKSR